METSDWSKKEGTHAHETGRLTGSRKSAADWSVEEERLGSGGHMFVTRTCRSLN